MKATSKLVLATVLGLLAVVSALPSFAVTPPALIIRNGTNTITIDQGGNVTYSTPCVNCTAVVTIHPGYVQWDGNIGTFYSSTANGSSWRFGAPSPNPPGPAAPQMLVGFAGQSSQAGTLTVQFSDAGFTQNDIGILALTGGGQSHGSVSGAGFADNTNTPFGMGIPGGTLGPFTTAPFSGYTTTGPVSIIPPFSMTVTATITAEPGQLSTGHFMLGMPGPLSLACPASTGAINTSYSSSLIATGGVLPYTFSIIGGTLSPLMLDSSSGAITGTPTSPGTLNFTAQVMDSSGLQGQNTISIGCTITIQQPLFELSGFTYADNNQNMVDDHGGPDTQIPNVTITLTDCMGNVLGTMMTSNPTGSYQFTNLPAGQYCITAPPTANGLNLETAPTITVTLGPNSDNNNFGYILPATCQAVSMGQVGVAFDSGPMNVTGGTAPYTFSVVGTLPPGLTLNTSNGEVTGIPSAPGSFSVKVTDSNGAMSQSCMLTITPNVTANCVVINAVAGFPITPVTLMGSGGVGPYTFTSTDLPAGLMLNQQTGIISGTPAASGMFTYHVTVTDSAGNMGMISCTVTVAPPPSANCLMIDAVQGQFVQTGPMTGSGGSGPTYTFSATGLPAGLTMASNGVISGTPSVNGTFNYTVTVTDSQGHTGTIMCSLTVAPTEGVNCAAINAVQGIPITPVTLHATGGYPPYSFSASGLPSGLTISSGGTISGTPTVNGTFPYTVTVTDSQGNHSTASCSITVQPTPPVTANCVTINAVQGVAITPVTITASGGVGGPYTFTATGLPAGLTMSSSGTISGTPTVTGTFPYTVTITDSAGNHGTISCSVTVEPPGNVCRIGPSSMEGALTDIQPGDWISGGYDFTIPGSHPQRTVTVTNITVTLPVYCPHGGGSGGSIVIPLPNASYVDTVNNNNWIPTGDQNSVLSWEGAIQAPDLCNGNPMANQSGAIYNATTNTGGGANFRFKYRDPNAKGKGNVDCADPNWNPISQRNDAATCGASWSQTVTCQ